MDRVFLADLGHNQVTMTSDVYPLGVANLAAYLHAYGPGRDRLSVEIFREPQALKEALETRPPTLLGLSSYAWNHNLAMQFAAYAKRRAPGVVTLMGGPNWPLTADEQAAYLSTLGPIDLFVQGPTYEGERALLNVVQRWVAVDGDRATFFDAPIDGAFWLDPTTGALVHGDAVPMITDLDEIPSPYQTGLLDRFFETGYFPLLQIARGCPFTCTFCNSAVAENSKVRRHTVENVLADLQYVAERVKPELPLCLADDNFGMYPWDEEIADALPALQERYGWPRYIRTTTGKNRHERIIRVMRKTGGILPMTAAVQSMSPDVMRNIKRDNIKLDAYRAIQREVVAQGMQSYGELILCLPGETKASFLQSVDDLLEAGVKRVAAHQLMLLHGAPLANPDERARWGFETRFRVVARNIGRYLDDGPTVEIEEIVVATPTFSLDDYYSCRVFHLLLTIYFYEGNFEEAFALGREHGVRAFDLVLRMQALLDDRADDFRTLIDEFVRESGEELFDSAEACRAWSERHFEGLIEGRVGGNLLSKYAMLGRFFVADAALDLLAEGLRMALPNDSVEAQRAVVDYLRGVMLHVPFRDSVEATPSWDTAFDIEAWRAADGTRPLSSFALPRPRRLHASVDAERKQLIASRIATFGEHPAGLGRFTRTLFAGDLRRTIGLEDAAAETSAAEELSPRGA